MKNIKASDVAIVAVLVCVILGGSYIISKFV